ncbi:MAG: uroporphyrinogen-III synthase [Rhodobacteraceae bacterium]|nr:uroporphyrinogen-III synthase [Paracoccaceae bacterium]
MTGPRPTLLMTRPAPASERFVQALNPALRGWLRVIVAPLTEIAAVPASADTTGIRGVIFSSANGVRMAAAAGIGAGLPAFCVGAATTRAAQQAGWHARQAGDDAQTLIDALLRDPPEAPLIHLHGVHSRGAVAETLTRHGVPTTGRVLYDQRHVPLSPDACAVLDGGQIVIAPLFSPRSAQAFRKALTGTAPVCAIAISAATAREMDGLDRVTVLTSPSPDAEAMRKLVENQVKQTCRVEGGPTPQ